MAIVCASALAAGKTQDVVNSGVAQLQAQLQDKPAIVFAFASLSQPLGEVMRGLRQAYPGVAVVGASSAGEFVNRQDIKNGTAFFALAGDVQAKVAWANGLKANPEAAAERVAKEVLGSVPGLPEQTAVLLLDPLVGVSEEATLCLAGLLGERVRLAGGAAGDDLSMKSSVVGLNGEMSNDALVVVNLFTKTRTGIGVAHGHKPLSTPLKVTRAEGNIVHTVEGRPAWDVWLENTRAAAASAGINVDSMRPDARGAFLLRFEAGLSNGKQFKVRAPLSASTTGALQFACGIAEGATIRIMQSTPEQQVDSAQLAAENARAQLTGGVAGALVFDCICRNLILDRKFASAVSAMHDALDRAPLAGFETYGEVALDASDMSGFHNTTSVVLAFGKD